MSGASTTPLVSIVVPARNCETTIGACLSSLARLAYPLECREILAVDNASKDRTGDVIRSHPVTYLHEPRRGAAAARNRGIIASHGEIIAFVDADCVAAASWLSEIVGEFADPEVSGVAGEVVARRATTPAERYVAVRRPRLQEMVLSRSRPYAGTANVAFRSRVFEEIGLFDPDLLIGEDKDFGWRFADARLKLRYKPQALVYHRHHETAWRLFVQCAAWGYGHALVHRKHDPSSSLRSELPEAAIPRAIRELTAGIVYCLLRRDRMAAWYPYLDLLRRVGLRAGALYGSLIRR